MQEQFDLLRFASALNTEKKWTRALGSQSIFEEKGEHSNLVRRVRLDDPVKHSICPHSDSPFHCKKLLHFPYHWTKALASHICIGHFAVSLYIANAGI